MALLTQGPVVESRIALGAWPLQQNSSKAMPLHEELIEETTQATMKVMLRTCVCVGGVLNIKFPNLQGSLYE